MARDRRMAKRKQVMDDSLIKQLSIQPPCIDLFPRKSDGIVKCHDSFTQF